VRLAPRQKRLPEIAKLKLERSMFAKNLLCSFSANIAFREMYYSLKNAPASLTFRMTTCKLSGHTTSAFGRWTTEALHPPFFIFYGAIARVIARRGAG
jgi:hypothetical protein